MDKMRIPLLILCLELAGSLARKRLNWTSLPSTAPDD